MKGVWNFRLLHRIWRGMTVPFLGECQGHLSLTLHKLWINMMQNNCLKSYISATLLVSALQCYFRKNSLHCVNVRHYRCQHWTATLVSAILGYVYKEILQFSSILRCSGVTSFLPNLVCSLWHDSGSHRAWSWSKWSKSNSDTWKFCFLWRKLEHVLRTVWWTERARHIVVFCESSIPIHSFTNHSID